MGFGLRHVEKLKGPKLGKRQPGREPAGSVDSASRGDEAGGQSPAGGCRKEDHQEAPWQRRMFLFSVPSHAATQPFIRPSHGLI